MFLDQTILKISEGLKNLYNLDLPSGSIQLQPTKKEFEGEFTLVVFPYTKDTKKSPEAIGQELGTFMVQNDPNIAGFNVVKGFLNFSFSDAFWLQIISKIDITTYGIAPKNGIKVMIEYSSPNTNKPLHLGHIRNILLGWSCVKIHEACGYEVIKTQIINDRGIAICKSMLAWQKFGGGKTPTSENIKGDHFVGDYYVLFESKFQEEYKKWQSSPDGLSVYSSKGDLDQTQDLFFKNYKNEYFNTYSILGEEARKMLINWENGDQDTIQLWKQMNSWVYSGFDETYAKLGVKFDKLYYESETYLLGKDAVKFGLDNGVFYQNPDNSIWVDLTQEGMDQKIVQRKDGTSVYITQDLGTAMMRYRDYGVDRMIYTVADEQDYHFQVLFKVLKRLGEPYADDLFHLSYGMVELPDGKMKSREGTVVDADDLIAEVVNEARLNTIERGEIAEMGEEEQNETIRKIGLAAIKYFMIKVMAKKRMIFDPKESVDLQGQTGPYIQNAYVRIKSILRKNTDEIRQINNYTNIHQQEKSLLTLSMDYPTVVLQACKDLDPSGIANYAYALAKEYHRFYHDVRILSAETQAAKDFRVELCRLVATILERSMALLGIEMPEKM